MCLAVATASPARADRASDLRAALVTELRAVPGDDIGAAAADLLASPKLAFSIGSVPGKKRLSAIYDNRRHAIVIDELYARETGDGVDLRTFARRISATVVHELQHAVDMREAGKAPHMREEEVSARCAEALYLRRRVARESGFDELDEMDAIARRKLKLGPPAGPWWRQPIPAGQEKRYIDAGSGHVRLDDWYMVRAAAGGADGLDRALRASSFMGEPAAALACARTPGDARRACEAVADLLRRRIARCSAALTKEAAGR